MKTFDQICDQVHDASGIKSLPNNYMWEQSNGIWYPVGQILDLIEIENHGDNKFTITLGDFEFSGTIFFYGIERSLRWEVEIDWYADAESESFYDENWELIDQLVYEKI